MSHRIYHRYIHKGKKTLEQAIGWFKSKIFSISCYEDSDENWAIHIRLFSKDYKFRGGKR